MKAVLVHGQFLPWLQSEFGMSQVTANNFMHVAEQFEGKLVTVTNLPVKALYLLASPSTPQEARDEALQRAESGEKITHALAKQIIEAQDAIKKAQEAETTARAEAQVAQQRLLKTEADTTSKIDDLTQQITALQQEMVTLTKPEEKIVEKEVLPEEKRKELVNLQTQVDKLNKDLEQEKKAIPPAAQQKLDKLQEDIKQLTAERDAHAQRIAKLNEDINTSIRKQEFAENQDRIRQTWRQVTSEAHASMMRLLGQWPTPLDVQTFEADDWARVEHLKETIRRILDECNRLRFETDEMIVDMAPHALMLME